MEIIRFFFKSIYKYVQYKKKRQNTLIEFSLYFINYLRIASVLKHFGTVEVCSSDMYMFTLKLMEVRYSRRPAKISQQHVSIFVQKYIFSLNIQVEIAFLKIKFNWINLSVILFHLTNNIFKTLLGTIPSRENGLINVIDKKLKTNQQNLKASLNIEIMIITHCMNGFDGQYHLRGVESTVRFGKLMVLRQAGQFSTFVVI